MPQSITASQIIFATGLLAFSLRFVNLRGSHRLTEVCMIWLLLLLFVAGYFIMERTTVRFPQSERVYNSGMLGFFIILGLTATVAIATHTPAPAWLLPVITVAFGGWLGVISAAGAALKKKIEAQVYSFCPVCAHALAEKQNGDTKVLACTSCRWMRDETR